MRSREQFDKLLLLAFLLNLFDAVITLWGIGKLGYIEMNPLMDTALTWGESWFFSIKVVVMALACYLLWSRYDRRPRGVLVTTLLITATLIVVCGWNIVEVSRSPSLMVLADTY